MLYRMLNGTGRGFVHTITPCLPPLLLLTFVGQSYHRFERRSRIRICIHLRRTVLFAFLSLSCPPSPSLPFPSCSTQHFLVYISMVVHCTLPTCIPCSLFHSATASAALVVLAYYKQYIQKKNSTTLPPPPPSVLTSNRAVGATFNCFCGSFISDGLLGGREWGQHPQPSRSARRFNH